MFHDFTTTKVQGGLKKKKVATCCTWCELVTFWL